MRFNHLVLTLVNLSLLSAVSAGLGCSGSQSSSSPTVASDAGTSDAGAGLAPADATKIAISKKGGFAASPPDGSTCRPVDTTYTFLPSTRALSWSDCASQDGGVYTLETGQKTLTPAEAATVQAAVDGLRRATQKKCGADAPQVAVTFTTPRGDVTYFDDFYYCNDIDGRLYVIGLDAVVGELTKLAK